jgi:hypothetical protein
MYLDNLYSLMKLRRKYLVSGNYMLEKAIQSSLKKSHGADPRAL